LALAAVGPTAGRGAPGDPADLFQPRAATVSDALGHNFVWREACGNSMDDHRLSGGFEWENDVREFLAWGEGLVRGERRGGLFMLAFPDANVLSATWPVHFAKGRRWRLRFALTDAAAAQCLTGLKLTVTATDAAGGRHVVVEQVIRPRDTRIYDQQVTFDDDVRALTFTHDNLGKECWDVLWLEPEGLVQPRTGTPLATQIEALGQAIDDLDQSFGQRYPRAAEFRRRLADLRQQLGAAAPAQPPELAAAFEALRQEALVANPLVSGQPLLFVVRPQYRSHYHAIDTLFHTGEFNPDRNVMHATLFQGGGALKTIDFGHGGEVKTLLDVPEGLARDPDVSFDARRVLFALRRHAAEDYHLWEINADGSGLRPLTRAEGVADFDPIYLPDDSIVFSSTRDPKFNQCSRDHGANLYGMTADGANIHQLEHNNLFQNQPSLLPDGRILYARWEYVDRNFGDAHGLWTMNPDGTNQAIFWGNNTASPGAAYTPRHVPGTGQALCIFGPHHDHLWGALALIDPALGINGRQSVLRIWPAAAIGLMHVGPPFDCDAFARLPLKYADPYPLSDKYFLCSRQTGWGDQMGIYLLDTFGNEILLHVEGPGCYSARPLAPRPRPPVIPGRCDYDGGEGLFYVSDVYQGTHLAGVERGSVKRLRVVEVPPKRFWSKGAWFGQGYTAPGMNWHALECKRILGSVPVEADGSAYFSVPADTLVYFQLLDAEGRMVQSMRSAAMVHSGEPAGCIGCHDDRHTSPPAAGRQALALRRPPSRLEEWRGAPRCFGFMAEVQPVLDRNCVRCHDYGQRAGAKLNLAADRDLVFNTAYVELWRKGYTGAVGAGPAQIQPARSWGSNASPLIKAIRGNHHGLSLDAESLDRLTTWVDLNAPYYASYASAYPDNWTGRCPLDDAQLGRLETLTGIPIRSKGSYAAYPGPLVSFERPELSPCLAGLGGPDDPRRREAVALIQAGAEQLAHRPRADMPGFQPNPTDVRREEVAAARWRIELRNRDAIRLGALIYDQ
jgi:hypothetical protein